MRLPFGSIKQKSNQSYKICLMAQQYEKSIILSFIPSLIIKIRMEPSGTNIQPSLIQQASINPYEKEKEPTSPCPSSSSSSEQFDYDDSNQKFFNLSEVKPLDFKAKWLGDTNAVLSKFQGKLVQLQKQKVGMREELSRFAQNESRWERSSLMRVSIVLDRKQLYDEYMQRTRKPIQKLHPSLILAICSYVCDSAFLALARIRRVSRIFNAIYKHEEVVRVFGERDLGFQSGVSLGLLEKWCGRWVDFRETFLYYKQMQYTVLIPQNSIKDDIEDAVDFINEVYKRAYALRSTHFAYYSLLNRFMRDHRISLALQALTFTDLAVTRKAAIVAFSNYLAFNPPARRKDEITKTNCLKMIQLVEDEHYRDSLLINSKLSAFLIDEYDYEFAVFIDTLHQHADHSNIENSSFLYDLVVFHLHNQMKSSLAKEVKIETRMPIQIGEVTISFTVQNEKCLLTYPLGGRMENEQLQRVYLPTFAKDGRFGHCYIYRGEFYYVLLITPPPHID